MSPMLYVESDLDSFAGVIDQMNHKARIGMPVRFPMLFSPGRIGTLKLSNRIVMAPMATNFADAEGEVTEWMIAYYAERARGGAGLIIIENANVDYPSGKSGTTQLRVDQDRFIPGLYRLSQAVHAEGGLCALQINHAGAIAKKGIDEGGQPLAPSKGPEGLYLTNPKVLGISEIQGIVQKFAMAASRAKKAGFDAVQIHGAHAYLIAQFFSPLTNQRQDIYGGSHEGRVRFAKEILTEVRKEVGPNFPVLIRLNASDLMEGGIDIQESAEIAKMLSALGVDAFDFSVGVHYQLNRSMCGELEPMSYKEKWRLKLIDQIKMDLTVPLLAVGPFHEPMSAETAIQEGEIDFAVFGRLFIADPQWPVKALNGKEKEIRHCISCNEGCVRARVFEDRPVSCTVNPEVGLESRNLIRSKTDSRKLMVVGGGPAGCAAAIYASQRGHEVVLIEESSRLGGKCFLGSRLPRKERLAWVVEYQRHELNHLGVDVRLHTSYSNELLKEISPHVLILSIGAVPWIPQNIEFRNETPLHAEDIIRKGIAWSRACVAVIGGGALGCEVAIALSEAQNDVIVLEAIAEAARDIEPISRYDLLDRLTKDSRVQLLTSARVRRVNGKRIHYEAAPGTMREINPDHIVWATGYTPRDLGEDLPLDRYPELEVRRIGDCLRPRNVFYAICDGFWLGMKI